MKKRKKPIYFVLFLMVSLSASIVRKDRFSFLYIFDNRQAYKVKVIFRVGKISAPQTKIVEPCTKVLLTESRACLKEVRIYNFETNKWTEQYKGRWCGDQTIEYTHKDNPNMCSLYKG